MQDDYVMLQQYKLQSSVCCLVTVFRKPPTTRCVCVYKCDRGIAKRDAQTLLWIVNHSSADVQSSLSTSTPSQHHVDARTACGPVIIDTSKAG